MPNARSRHALLPALVLALASACGGGQRFDSTITQSETYDFGSVETFSIVQLAPPEGLEQGAAGWAARYDVALENALRDELTARGLTELEAGQPADLAFTFAYGGERRRVQAMAGNEIGYVNSVEGQLVFEARDGEAIDEIVWSNTIDFFLQEEWPPIERAEANAPNVVGQALATFPIAKPGAEPVAE